MKFAYRAFDKSGKATSGTVEASDAASAGEALRGRGLFVSEISAAGGAAPREARASGGAKRLKHLSAFMRQLAVLISTGTPLVQGIEACERQATDPAWKAVLADVRRRVEEGVAFSDALAAHPGCFDAVCRSLVLAGESGGKLDQMLQNLAELTRRQVRTRDAIVGAMVYPTLLLCVAVTVSLTMIVFVLPRFKGLFANLDTPLPPTTKLLMDVSDMLRQQWMWHVPAAVIGIGALVWWVRSDGGRAWVDRTLIRLPQVGKVARGLICARLARVLGVLLDGKVPLLDALALTRGAMSNREYAALLKRTEDAVTKGLNVSDAIADSTLVPIALSEAVRSGERSGRLAPVLLGLAAFIEEDNDVALRSLTSIIEPVILLGLGLVVGTVALSMFLPLFDLASAGAGGGR